MESTGGACILYMYCSELWHMEDGDARVGDITDVCKPRYHSIAHTYTHMPITVVDDGHHSDQGMAFKFILCWRRLFLTTG